MNIMGQKDKSETSSINSEIDDFQQISISALSRTDSNFLVSATKSDIEQVKFAAKKTPTKINSRIPEKMSINPIRRKSKIEKEEELSRMKLGAMNQIENTIKITDLVKDRGSKLTELQTENDNLRREVHILKSKLEESKSLNSELVDRLRAASEAQVQRKIESENERTNKFVDVSLSPTTCYDIYIQDIISSRDRLLGENRDLKVNLERSENQIFTLSETIKYLEEITDPKLMANKGIDDTNIDSRSKTELLHLIREHLNDKMTWMDYAIKLTKQAVYFAPDLLQINQNVMTTEEREEFCCKSEEKWASFAITLLQSVQKVSPTLIQSLIDSKDSLSSDLMKSKHLKIEKLSR